MRPGFHGFGSGRAIFPTASGIGQQPRQVLVMGIFGLCGLSAGEGALCSECRQFLWEWRHSLFRPNLKRSNLHFPFPTRVAKRAMILCLAKAGSAPKMSALFLPSKSGRSQRCALRFVVSHLCRKNFVKDGASGICCTSCHQASSVRCRPLSLFCIVVRKAN